MTDVTHDLSIFTSNILRIFETILTNYANNTAILSFKIKFIEASLTLQHYSNLIES
jgi:hypothetical protein